ncbi:TPA: hypothetical protein ACHK7E_004764, partial [Escherichia coli]
VANAAPRNTKNDKAADLIISDIVNICNTIEVSIPVLYQNPQMYANPQTVKYVVSNVVIGMSNFMLVIHP